MAKQHQKKSDKKPLHPRNRHLNRYDFDELVKACPELEPFVFVNKYKSKTITFSDAEAVKLLNKALLKRHYQIDNWDIPKGYLCPPIPGRADYIHYLADLLASKSKKKIPKGKSCLLYTSPSPRDS